MHGTVIEDMPQATTTTLQSCIANLLTWLAGSRMQTPLRIRFTPAHFSPHALRNSLHSSHPNSSAASTRFALTCRRCQRWVGIASRREFLHQGPPALYVNNSSVGRAGKPRATCMGTLRPPTRCVMSAAVIHVIATRTACSTSRGYTFGHRAVHG